jgi:hypothetical protein
MSFPRLILVALCLPLLTGACAAVTAASYGADGVSYVDSGKSTTDHFASMVSKKDCAFLRAFRNQNICRPRDGDKDPYKVDYDTAERQPSDDGVAYAPPLHASAGAPASSWTAEAYKPVAAPAPALAPEPVTAIADANPPPQAAPTPKAAAPKAAKKKAKAHAKAKKPSPSQVASVP